MNGGIGPLGRRLLAAFVLVALSSVAVRGGLVSLLAQNATTGR